MLTHIRIIFTRDNVNYYAKIDHPDTIPQKDDTVIIKNILITEPKNYKVVGATVITITSAAKTVYFDGATAIIEITGNFVTELDQKEFNERVREGFPGLFSGEYT